MLTTHVVTQKCLLLNRFFSPGKNVVEKRTKFRQLAEIQRKKIHQYTKFGNFPLIKQLQSVQPSRKDSLSVCEANIICTFHTGSGAR